MLQADHELLQPGMKIRIAPKLMGEELYGSDDPELMKAWCGKEATVKYVKEYDHWMVGIEEDDVEFFMEEIECVIEDAEIDESGESLDVLLGGIV